jgi:hypothetical protein
MPTNGDYMRKIVEPLQMVTTRFKKISPDSCIFLIILRMGIS